MFSHWTSMCSQTNLFNRQSLLTKTGLAQALVNFSIYLIRNERLRIQSSSEFTSSDTSECFCISMHMSGYKIQLTRRFWCSRALLPRCFRHTHTHTVKYSVASWPNQKPLSYEPASDEAFDITQCHYKDPGLHPWWRTYHWGGFLVMQSTHQSHSSLYIPVPVAPGPVSLFPFLLILYFFQTRQTDFRPVIKALLCHWAS